MDNNPHPNPAVTIAITDIATASSNTTGITYDKLRGGSGIQWPCNDANPEGTERLYLDGKFWSSPQYC
ncbi:hypothetical protein, partial [Rhodococcus chondri]